jgi:hypothetical protein
MLRFACLPLSFKKGGSGKIAEKSAYKKSLVAGRRDSSFILPITWQMALMCEKAGYTPKLSER